MSILFSLFAGALVKRSGGADLAREARQLVGESFGEHPESLKPKEFRQALERARLSLQEPLFRNIALQLLQDLGLSTKGLRLDLVRLRAVAPGLEDIDAAAPVFYPHRDTWYGNPKCQINAWIPLQDVDQNNSFRFYLDHFETGIANDSKHFSANSFRGFGKVAPAERCCYPRAQTTPRGKVHDVCIKNGEVLLFSAAHLHQTLPNQTDRVRFSVDFRFFYQHHLTTEAGAPDPDNQSRGLCIEGYLPCS